MIKRRLFFRTSSEFAVLLTAATFCSHHIYAKPPGEFYDLPKVVAIQDRPYYNDNDITLQLGWLPSDAFNKGFSGGLAYAYYFKDYLAWEVVNANYVINQETSLKNEFENLNIDIESEGFDGVLDFMQWYATTSIIYTPFYNKSLLFNESVVHGNTSLVIGGGLAGFKETGTRAMFTGGIILKFFSSPTTSWKFDFRNNVYFEETLGAVYALSINLGVAFELGDAKKQK